MREILFRGKRLYICDWVEGTGIFNDGTNTWISFNEPNKPIDFGMKHQTVYTETVGQFTGLTDKNGKKIFEGDIGRYKQTDGAKRNGKPIICIGKVVYNAKTASFAVESKDEAGCNYFDYFPIKDFDVIGNIHDNPELLEV